MISETPYFLDDQIVALAKEEVLGRDERLFVQHARAEHIFLLVDGNLKFYGSAGAQQILTGQLYSPNSPVGLSAFHPPYRHEVEARVNSESATILKWKRAELFDFLAIMPELAINFFGFINTQGQRLIEESSELFLSMTGAGKSLKPDIILTKKEESPLEQDEDDATLFLLQSPFFEVFEEKFLRVLAAHLQRYQYASGDVLYLQGGACSGIDILESGEVQFSRNNVTTQGEQTVWFRSISTPGYLLGSAGVLNQVSDMTVTVSKDAVVYNLPIEVIRTLEKRELEFGLKLQERVSWLLMNQLRMVQARLLSAEFVEETIVVTNLIRNNQSKLSLDSPLHIVPHLLKEKLTTRQGLEMLHQVELNGKNHERNLASLSLDNLQKTQKEMAFYEGLMRIYSSVVSAPEASTPEALQIQCNDAARKAFKVPSVSVSGYNNLPEKSGHIFIYNHLLNDPYYTLPNQFQITLDAHYLSAVLYEKYGKSAVRIVRIGREAEYAHEDYYDRLGFLNVYTVDSRQVENLKEKKRLKREQLFAQIEEKLAHGINVIISPEVTSYPTDQSPGKFKTGIFRMAMDMKVEPLIVPIVAANFDLRISDNTFLCEIKEPFRISERLQREPRKDLKAFLAKYQKEYKGYVQELTSNLTNGATRIQR